MPIADAETGDDEVRLAYSKDQIKDAPNVDADGELSRDEERALYEHYGRSDYGDYDGSDARADGVSDRARGHRPGRRATTR